MSIRTWGAEQSGEIEIETGGQRQIRPVVTQEDLIKALVDLAIVLDRCGGTAGIVLKRIPAPIPGSMVTEQAVIQWQERTNAKPQPEPNALEDVEIKPLFEPTVPEPVVEQVELADPEQLAALAANGAVED